MEEKPYSIVDQLCNNYQLNNLHFECQCKTKMELLCTLDCKEPSLHCQNADCKFSYQKHKFCRKIQLKGLSELLAKRFDSYKTFLEMIQKVEQDFIARIRKEREKVFNKIIFKQFQDEQIVTLQNLFIRKNVGSIKGIHVEEVYKKLLHQKESKRKTDEYVSQYQNQFKQLQIITDRLRKCIGKQSQKLFYKKSNIIYYKQLQQAKFVLNCLKNPKELRLLFRASQHQFSAAEFHRICDGIPNLLVLVKTEFGKIIGGFNSIGWKAQLNGYSADNENKCFIFSVTLRQKMDLIKPQYAIQYSRQFGPIFGGCDIALSDKC